MWGGGRKMRFWEKSASIFSYILLVKITIKRTHARSFKHGPYTGAIYQKKSHGDNNKKKTSPLPVLPKSPVLNVRLLSIKTFLIEGLTSEWKCWLISHLSPGREIFPPSDLFPRLLSCTDQIYCSMVSVYCGRSLWDFHLVIQFSMQQLTNLYFCAWVCWDCFGLLSNLLPNISHF